MNYSQIVDKYIKESGLSLGEIATRMQNEKGIKIDRSYISKLKNNPKYPASEEINRALAEITGGDPDKLVMAAYFEKAPEEVKHAFEESRSVIRNLLRITTDGQLTEEEINLRMKELETLSLDELVKESKAIVASLSEPHQLLEAFKMTSEYRNASPEKKEYMVRLMNLRKEKKLSTAEVANWLEISEKLYKQVEAYGGIESEELNMSSDDAIAKLYKEALELVEKYTPSSDDKESEFNEFINNPEHGIFFKEYLNAPEEKREEMRQIFKILMDKEKGRKPGDRQGE